MKNELKNINNLKERTLYHISHNDLDGFGCTYIVNNISLFKEKNYFNINYTDLKETINKIFQIFISNKEKKFYLLITDIGLPDDIVNKINNFIKGNKNIDVIIQVLDHHKSEVAEKNDWYYLDINNCATRLTYLYFKDFLINKEYFNNFSLYVQSQDLWLENDKNFNKACFISDFIFNSLKFPYFLKNEEREYKFYFMKKLFDLFNTEKKTIDDVENEINSLKRNYFSSFNIKNDKNNTALYMVCTYFYKLLLEKEKNKELEINYIKIGNYKGKFIYNLNTKYFQIISNFYLKENDIDFMVHVDKEKKMSFRSLNDVDVQFIAKNYFNGGGHKNASGAYCPELEDFFNQNTLEKSINNHLLLQKEKGIL